MLWAIFVMLLTIGFVGLLGSNGLIANVIQILLVGALVALGIQRIHALSNRLRRYQQG
jgi:hypothetical protein